MRIERTCETLGVENADMAHARNGTLDGMHIDGIPVAALLAAYRAAR